MAKCKRNRNRTKRSFTVKEPKANRNYKDTVFRMLFSDRKNLLSLYNAVNQTDYRNPEELEIVTLENAIYMGMKNDLAFIMDTNLYLYEHQSTYNPNMPLRDLFYICSEYQKLVDKKSLFSSTLQKIPAPNFIEFYNGSTEIADCTELRLSSAFEHLSGEPKLELVVTVFNVNEGHNAELMQHCSMLKEYAQYVARVRHYASDMPLNQAVKRAVDECIREGILAEFLARNRNEVISMSIFEYDKELEEKNIIVKRPYKTVYKCDDSIVKVFAETHPKSDVFNEALNTARVEEAGLDIPKGKEVSQIDGKWAIVIEYKEGKTLEEMMESDKKNLAKYMDDFVALQLEVQSKHSPLLKGMKDKLARQINGLKDLDATTRYELMTRLESMPKHNKICHGDFNPSNVIVGKNGKMTVVDWAHATQGNASADAAMTYLLFALKDQEVADLYLNTFCKKSDTAKQYVQQWLPIVAAAQLSKENELEKDFLMRWIDVVDYQ